MDQLTSFDANNILPADADKARLIGRVWLPGKLTGSVAGPAVVAVKNGYVYNMSEAAATCSELLERDNRLPLFDEACQGDPLCSLDTLLETTVASNDSESLRLLSPIDLQCIKAAGVTFAVSLIERLIEERAEGDFTKADAIRDELVEIIGDDLSKLKPGSDKAEELASHLKSNGMWSQYMEVGIGPDAEIFSKAQVMSSVGCGSDIGLHPSSEWNNPEPEVVLAVTSTGQVVGATLGNDVNLRDIEGRSALLLTRAKDNNASCALGPFIRLVDDHFSLDDIRAADVTLQIVGEDGFVLDGYSSMKEISRDILDLVAQTVGPNHQYPDGFVLMTGTLFAPTQDRGEAGAGFTHKMGDQVAISSSKLGTLVNRVTRSDKAAPWSFGISDLMRNLAARGLFQ